MLRHETIAVGGMDCADCARSIERGVAVLPGVSRAQVNFALGQLAVEYEAERTDRAHIVGRVRELGYDAETEVASAAAAERPRGRARAAAFARRNPRLIATALSGLLLAVAAAGELSGGEAQVVIGALAAVAVGGYHVARSGWRALTLSRTLDMNALMSLAVIGAVAIGEWLEAGTVVFLFALGNALESLTVDRARGAIRQLIAMAPREARVRRDGAELTVPVEEVRVGDVVRVRPGERVAVDGVVLTGASSLDQAPITGESVPVDKAAGDGVFAGSVNGPGYLEVRASREYRDTTIARIVRLVEEAQVGRAPTQRLVDRFSARYTPAVIAGAVAIAVVPPVVFGLPFGEWFYRALVLLVIACPCALVISTPVAIVAAITRAARDGVLVKGGAALEELGRVRVVAVDKTGTLTTGRPEVVGVVPVALGRDELVGLAAGVEARSEHPLARAVVRYAQHEGVEVPFAVAFEALPGRGARGRVLVAAEALGVPSPPGSLSRARERGDLLRGAEGEGGPSRSPAAQAGALGEEAAGSMDGAPTDGGALTDGSGPAVAGGTLANGAARWVAVGSPRWLQADGVDLAPVRAALEEQESAGRTALVVAVDGAAAGVIALADRPRAGAREAIERLRRAGVRRIVMLTGDNERTATAIGREVGVEDVRAGLLPEDKVAAVEGLGANVAMVGDGVNDAPALAAASVGIAMGAAGSAVALETADVALMADDLAKAPHALALAHEALSTIRQNVAISLATKAIFLALGAFGFAGLWLAVLADMGTSLLVTVNGMRLLRWREDALDR